MLTLFGNLDSGNVHKAQLILRRAGVSYRRVDVAQPRGEPRSEAFLKINPIGKVPAVRFEDGDVLSESGAIMYFFARATNLWPSGSRLQAEVLRRMFFEQYNHEPALAVIRYLRRYTSEPEAHAADAAARLQPKGYWALEVMQRRLSERRWIATEACTIADYALYPYTRLADEAGFRLADFPAVEDWLARMERQPEFLRVYGEGAAKTLSFERYLQVESSPAKR